MNRPRARGKGLNRLWCINRAGLVIAPALLASAILSGGFQKAYALSSRIYSLKDPKALLFTLESTTSKPAPGKDGKDPNYDQVIIREYHATETSAKPGQDLKIPAVKETIFLKERQVQRIELSLPAQRESGFADVRGDHVHMSYTVEGKTRTGTLDLEQDLILTNNLHEYFVEHLPALQEGKTLKFRLLVIDRFETFGFEAFLTEKTADTFQVRVKPSSFVIAAFVEPLLFTFKNAKDGHPPVLDRVAGPIKPKIWRNGGWHMTSGLTLFNGSGTNQPPLAANSEIEKRPPTGEAHPNANAEKTPSPVLGAKSNAGANTVSGVKEN